MFLGGCPFGRGGSGAARSALQRVPVSDCALRSVEELRVCAHLEQDEAQIRAVDRDAVVAGLDPHQVVGCDAFASREHAERPRDHAARSATRGGGWSSALRAGLRLPSDQVLRCSGFPHGPNGRTDVRAEAIWKPCLEQSVATGIEREADLDFRFGITCEDRQLQWEARIKNCLYI